MTPAEIVAAYRAGTQISVIMRTGRVNHRTVRKALAAAGVLPAEVPLDRRTVTPDQLQQIVSAYRAGTGLRPLGEKHHLNPSTVRRVLVDAGVPIRQPGFHESQSRDLVRPQRERAGPLDPETLARLRRAVGLEVAAR